MVHLLTWPRIRLVVRAATIYTPLRGRKHHFRWLLRWRNLPVRANPHGLLRLTAYLRFASCLSTPGWMCIGIEYRQTASSFLFTRLEIFCPFLWNLRPDRSCHFSVSPLSFLLQPSSCACATSPFSSLVFASLSSIRSQESLRLVLSVERGISAMLRLLSRIWVRFNYEPLKEAGQLLLRVDSILKYFERSETFSFFYFSLLSNAYLRDCKTWIINLRFIIISLSKNIFHRTTVAR